MKIAKCKSCGQEYVKERMAQVCCSMKCAYDHVAKQREAIRLRKEREARVADKKRLEGLKPLKFWLDKAQIAVNNYIRERDKDLPCISCGRHHSGQYHAGHLHTVKARPDIRFHHDNIHKQCQPCNTELSGNVLAFRENLIAKIGQERVDALRENKTKRWTKEEALQIEADHKKLLKELKGGV